ncbi:glycosyltransferase [Clostridium perfringens]|uniref:glycosyltransferase n=1 Tax=Clostridium perfringens TaxID=1502 RepID=UPI0022E8D879|nr:glycosyltransferase [Clostridium perfringens]MDU6895282.1 glycosyltransferase [Clostridium perfringens]MDU6932583.1 glycosyltransferase [Clostridium perfringens]
MKRSITFIIGIMGNGGAERVVSILANYFINENIDINIITIYGDKIDYELDNRIKYYPIVCKGKIKLFRYIERILKIRKNIKRANSDVVISFLADVNIQTLIASIFTRNKVIISERNDPYNDPSNKYIRKFRDIIYKLGDGFVFQTVDAKNYFSKKIKGKSTIIENPIKNNLPQRYTGLRKKEIITISRLNPQKNLKLLIDSYYLISKEYSDYILIIYGEGELRTELQEYVVELGLENKVRFPGFEKNIHSKIVDSSMFVLSSNYEGISNAMLEALAIGVPVIATDCPIGGAKMNIQSYKNGILVPIKNKVELYKAMKEIIENPELAENLSKNSVCIKEKLKEEVICKKWLSFIETVGIMNEIYTK